MEVDQSDSNRLCVPEFAQAWHPSVRRPTVLPHPGTYDESIDPDAIFELRKTPRSKYIFVIPHKCVGCHSAKSSCSRLSPCTRCSDAARTCHASVREGYQELPMVKASRKRSSVSESIPKAPSLSRPKRAAATQSIINQKPLTKKLKLASASLGPPGRPIERRGDKEKVDVNPSPQKASIASNTSQYLHSYTSRVENRYPNLHFYSARLDASGAWKDSILKWQLCTRPKHTHPRHPPSHAPSMGKCEVPRNHASESNRLTRYLVPCGINCYFSRIHEDHYGYLMAEVRCAHVVPRASSSRGYLER